MSTPVYSQEVALLRAELAEAQVRAIQARLDALTMSSNSAAASTSASATSCPLIGSKLRESERRILLELVRVKGGGPLLVWFRLFDATVNGKKHEIAALIEEDGSFGYKKVDGSYLNGLHSFEVMWWIRSEYNLSGSVPYEDLLADGRTFHCLKFAFLDGETRYSLLGMAHDILKDLDSDKKSGYVTPPSSPIRPTHPPSLKRKKYPQGGGGKASNSAAASSVASSSVASSSVASSSVASSSVASGGKASVGKASSNAVSNSAVSNSVASNSVASNSVASSSMPYTSLRPPPGIQRKPEMVILAGGILKAPLSLSSLYKPR
jgi:hypothetical protein